MARKGISEHLWTHKEAAAYLRISITQLYVLNRGDDGPPSYKVGGLRRYDPAEVQAWLRTQAPVESVA